MGIIPRITHIVNKFILQANALRGFSKTDIDIMTSRGMSKMNFLAVLIHNYIESTISKKVNVGGF